MTRPFILTYLVVGYWNGRCLPPPALAAVAEQGATGRYCLAPSQTEAKPSCVTSVNTLLRLRPYQVEDCQDSSHILRGPGSFLFHHEPLIAMSAMPFVMPNDDCNFSVTTSTTFRKASISSSTVPPSPAPERLSELPTYVGRPVFLAKRRARREARSREDSTLNNGVEMG